MTQPGITSSGFCDPRFERVPAAFEENFRSAGEVGAQASVMVGGEIVVDLWGGHLDVARTATWRDGMITPIYSITKIFSAICVLMLAERGDVDLDEPVATYWPGFERSGKAGVLLRHVLGHTAGLPGWDIAMSVEDLEDWDRCTDSLAAQSPWWEPGTASGYHAAHAGIPARRGCSASDQARHRRGVRVRGGGTA